MKKVKFALAAFAFVAAVGGALSTKAVAGPNDPCTPTTRCGDDQVICCSIFQNGQVIGQLDGNLLNP